MWHEARKQEKKIRGMLVDYRRRAERRRDYYEKIVRASAEKNTIYINRNILEIIKNTELYAFRLSFMYGRHLCITSNINR